MAPATDDEAADHPALVDGGRASPRDFSDLRTLDLGTVPIMRVGLAGITAIRRGHDPLQARVGDCCGDLACPYALYEVSLFRDEHDLSDRVIGDTRRRLPELPAKEILDGLKLDVWRVQSSTPLRIADLRTHPILYRVPLTVERLRRYGSRDEAPRATDWELVRLIRDSHASAGLQVVSQSGSGSDLLLHPDALAVLHAQRLGTIQDVLPTVERSSAALALERLARRLGSDPT